jgi:hypothetical protein
VRAALSHRRTHGLVDPVDDFERHKKSKNNTPRYVYEIMTKVKRAAKTLKWRKATDITGHGVEGFHAMACAE